MEIRKLTPQRRLTIELKFSCTQTVLLLLVGFFLLVLSDRGSNFALHHHFFLSLFVSFEVRSGKKLALTSFYSISQK